MDKRELDELSNAIETIKNYCKDLENEKQFLIKPEKDIDTEMQTVIMVIIKLANQRNMKSEKYLNLLVKQYDKVVKIADFVFKDYIQNKKYAM